MARDIAARVAERGFDFLDAPIKTVTAPDTPVPFSGVLESHYTPNSGNVIAAVAELLGVRL
jgi:acetoin:2,6-dichlorophenolindophenol oxidoreductase subunit beta